MSTMTSSTFRSARAAMAACALALATACQPVRPSTAPEPAAALEAREWTAQSPAPEIAAWAWQGCRRAAGGAGPCVERALVSLIDQAGVGKSMEVLDTLAGREPVVKALAHSLAHGLGISAYRSPETVAQTFAGCPASQMSGCYHGVVQGYFLDLGAKGQAIDRTVLDGLCAPHGDKPFLYFQCAHGMGHGLMTVHQNQLPMALEACDQASDAVVRESCYGGAFMENIVNALHPHHTATGHAQTQGEGHGQHAAADAHGSGGHDAHAAAPGHGEWKALDPADPRYPCSVVDEKYQASCYNMQSSPVMQWTQGDLAATARMCAGAPEGMRLACFSGLGRELTAWMAQDHGRSIEACRRVGAATGTREQSWCLVGAAETLINQTADARDGIRFCRAVDGGEAKRECYEAAGRFMRTLVATPEGRAEQCALAEPEHVASCRQGARLDPSASDD
jgi:hypothetical protein